MRVYELLLDVSGAYDLRGVITKDYQDARFLVSEWNLKPEDLDCDDFNQLHIAIDQAIQQLINCELISRDPITNAIAISGWEEFYGKKDLSTERVRKHRGTKTANNETGETLLTPHTEPTPLTTEESTARNIAALWNDWAGQTKDVNGKGIPQVTKLAGDRLKLAMARAKEYPSLDFWKAALAKVASIPGLMGANDRGWTVTFDWIVQPMSVAKLIEGKYDKWGRKNVEAKAVPSDLYGPDNSEG